LLSSFFPDFFPDLFADFSLIGFSEFFFSTFLVSFLLDDLRFEPLAFDGATTSTLYEI
jgi:hypothetical protein